MSSALYIGRQHNGDKLGNAGRSLDLDQVAIDSSAAALLLFRAISAGSTAILS